MNLFFTAPVNSYSLLASHHEACKIVEELIATGYAQFELEAYDNSDPYNMVYSRVKSLKLKVHKMISLIQTKYNQALPQLSKNDKQITIGKMKNYMDQMQIDHLKYLDRKQYEIENKFQRFIELTKIYDQFLEQFNRNIEQIEVCKAKAQAIKNKDFLSKQFTLLIGSCLIKDCYMLQRLIFRKTHGHAYIFFNPSNNSADRSIFVCFLNQGIYKHIGSKVQQLFIINKVNLYELPHSQNSLELHKQKIQKENQELEKVLSISGQQLISTLRDQFVCSRDNLRNQSARLSYLERLLYIVCHSRKIGNPNNYIMLTVHMPADQAIPNLPASQIPIDHSLKAFKKRTILPRLPCLSEVNTLTELYSIPKHNQLLPQIFMFSTVPVLFGMMFSDFGHGLMLLAPCIILKLSPIFYLMSFMSIYCGVIYNEFFGMKIIQGNGELGILDGKWGAAENGLNFENSLKMKISMVIAFVHMSFGLILKIINQLKRSQRDLIIYDSLPKLGLLFTTVGYLVFLIIIKWLTDFSGHEATAPSIINSFLQLYLGWNYKRKHSILGSMQVQKYVGQWLVNLNFWCILVMVYNHTIRLKVQCFWMKKAIFSQTKRKNYKQINERESIEQFENGLIGQKDQIKQISEELVEEGHKFTAANSKWLIERQYYAQEDFHESQLGVLQVFQYVLSLISSTTSYLRLFALSLAHAELSHLLLNFLLGGLSAHQPNISFVRCLIFFVVTIGMMLVLDVMECIMHVVRLHWVEWMGKFYQGGGRIWAPEGEENWE